jgi:hypothetical protein
VYYILVIFGTVIFVLGLNYLSGDTFYTFATKSTTQLNLILDKGLDENEKQRLLIINLKGLLFYFAKIIAIVVAVILVSALPAYIYIEWFQDGDISPDLVSYKFIGSTIIGSLVIFLLPKNQDSDYTYWSKLLHEIFLGNYNLSKLFFKVEQRSSKNSNKPKNYIVVSGLARAGTTAATKLLFSSKHFYSLSYANMPVLLSPNLWSKVYKPKESVEKERAHGDRMKYSLGSIEALDEFFFKANLNDSYISQDSLSIHEIGPEIYDRYKDYQKIIRKNVKQNYYLTKNNNFALRYESIRKLDPKFIYVVVIREPIEHASSLLRQHNNFLNLQKDDPFILKYMNWLGHYEFGQNHKVFNFEKSDSHIQSNQQSLDYWINIWFNYYSYVIKFIEQENVVVLTYEDLVEKPDEFIREISYLLDDNIEVEKKEKFNKSVYDIDHELLDQNLLSKVSTLYSQFRKG